MQDMVNLNHHFDRHELRQDYLNNINLLLISEKAIIKKILLKYYLVKNILMTELMRNNSN